jgi:hypothetical protein
MGLSVGELLLIAVVAAIVLLTLFEGVRRVRVVLALLGAALLAVIVWNLVVAVLFHAR